LSGRAGSLASNLRREFHIPFTPDREFTLAHVRRVVYAPASMWNAIDFIPVLAGTAYPATVALPGRLAR